MHIYIYIYIYICVCVCVCVYVCIFIHTYTSFVVVPFFYLGFGYSYIHTPVPLMFFLFSGFGGFDARVRQHPRRALGLTRWVQSFAFAFAFSCVFSFVFSGLTRYHPVLFLFRFCLQVSVAVTRECVNILDVHSETLVPGQVQQMAT